MFKDEPDVILHLGDDIMKKLDLYPKREGYSTGYDKGVDPSISNQFAVAASRLAQAAVEVPSSEIKFSRVFKNKLINR